MICYFYSFVLLWNIINKSILGWHILCLLLIFGFRYCKYLLLGLQITFSSTKCSNERENMWISSYKLETTRQASWLSASCITYLTLYSDLSVGSCDS